MFENYDRLFHHITRKHPLGKSQHGGGEGTTNVHHKKARKEPNNRHDDTPSTMNANRSSEDRTSLNQNKHPEEQRGAKDETALNKAVVNRTIIPQIEEVYDLLLFFVNSREPIGPYYFIYRFLTTTFTSYLVLLFNTSSIYFNVFTLLDANDPSGLMRR